MIRVIYNWLVVAVLFLAVAAVVLFTMVGVFWQ